MMKSVPAVLTLKSSGADSSVPTAAFHKVVTLIVVRTLGMTCGRVGGVKSHPLQKRQRMGHPRRGEFGKKRDRWAGRPMTARGVKRLSTRFLRLNPRQKDSYARDPLTGSIPASQNNVRSQTQCLSASFQFHMT